MGARIRRRAADAYGLLGHGRGVRFVMAVREDGTLLSGVVRW